MDSMARLWAHASQYHPGAEGFFSEGLGVLGTGRVGGGKTLRVFRGRIERWLPGAERFSVVQIPADRSAGP